MRTILSLSLGVAVLAAAGLSACASGPPGENSYTAQMDRLEADCRARGGILTPTGATSGRPQRDYACQITGGASRIDND